MHVTSRSRWAVARTVVAASGLGFVTIALGGACLDYAGESFGTCPTNASTAATSGGSGNGDGTLKAGSGVGNGAPAAAAGMDCGTTPASVPEAGGSGSAAP